MVPARPGMPPEHLTKTQRSVQSKIEAFVHNKDLAGLRRAARDGNYGLVSAQCRRQAWPLLAGVDRDPPLLAEGYSHPEQRQVDLDLNRSLFHVTDEALRAELRQGLKRMLLAALTKFGEVEGDCEATRRYYQGLHDIASVLLLVLGEREGAAVLEILLSWHLRPYMEGGAGRMAEVLSLVQPLLHAADGEMGAALEKTLIEEGMGSNYALPWVITWMTHNYTNRLDVSCRLVDYFLATPPIMSVYLAVAVASSRRQAVLEHDDPAMQYSALSRLPADPPLQAWLMRANELADKVLPPVDLVRMVYGTRPPPVLDPRASPLFFLPTSVSGVRAELAEREKLFEQVVAERAAVPANPPAPSAAAAAAQRRQRTAGDAVRALWVGSVWGVAAVAVSIAALYPLQPYETWWS